ncbi:VWA domain-containing protein [Flexivirga sp. B27]
MTSPAESAGRAAAKSTPLASPLASRFTRLGAAMRGHGIRVGPSEVTDAARVAATLGFDHRERLRAGMAAAMVRQAEDRSTFDHLFDIFFPAATGRRTASGDHIGDETGDADLIDQLSRALATGDDAELERIAAAAVDLLGSIDEDNPDRGWSSARTLEALAPQRAIASAHQQLRATQEGAGGEGNALGAGSGMTPAAPSPDSSAGNPDTSWATNPWDRPSDRPEQLTDRVDRDELRRRVDDFRGKVQTESRRRNAELRDRDRLAQLAVPTSLRRRDFISSGEKQLHELRREIDPLARKLAARMTARERAGRGAIDVRRTLRASLSTGGVPIAPAYHRRAPHRPDLVLFADLSGSVGGFSTFTMLLMQALHQHFRRVRVFGFISSTAEITDVVHNLPPGRSLTSWALGTSELIRRGPSSNYGWALRTFTRGHLDAITTRSTVLVLGDARNNFADPNTTDLTRIRDRARYIAWLNPEPRKLWSQGDSEVRRYREIVPMHECRNLEQLRHFVAEMMPT